MTEQESGVSNDPSLEIPQEAVAEQQLPSLLVENTPLKPAKPYGYWTDPGNIEIEGRQILDSGVELKQTTMRDAGFQSMISAVSRHYPGGLVALRAKLEPDKHGIEETSEYWRIPENIEQAARQTIANGVGLTRNELKQHGIARLEGAIYLHYPGGIAALKEKLGQLVVKRSNGYWQDPATIEAEARAYINSGKTFSQKDLEASGLAILRSAAKESYPGGWKALQEKLGHPPEKKEVGYWQDPDNIEKEAQKAIDTGIVFTQRSFQEAGFSSLATAVTQNYPGGIHALREKLGADQIRVQRRFWEDPANIENAARKIIDSEGQLSEKRLRQIGQSSLSYAISTNYPGGIRALRQKIGIDSPENVPKGYWKDLANIEEAATKLFAEEGAFNSTVIKRKKMLSLGHAIQNYYPGGIKALQAKLAVKTRYNPVGYWTESNIEDQTRRFFEEHGKLTTGVLEANDRKDLAWAISTHYEGGIAGLRDKLGIPSDAVPRNYWNQQTIFTEAKKFLDEHGDINHVLMRVDNKNGLATAISNSYPGGMTALKRDLGIESGVPQEPSVSPDEADVFFRGLEVEQ